MTLSWIHMQMKRIYLSYLQTCQDWKMKKIKQNEA